MWVVLGTIFQFFLSFMLFMLSVFTGGGVVNEQNLSPIGLMFLNVSILVLPGTCFLSIGLVMYQYIHGGSSIAFWWYAMPLVVAGVYMAIAVKLTS